MLRLNTRANEGNSMRGSCTNHARCLQRKLAILQPSEENTMPIVERIGSRTIRFVGKDMVEISKFLEFVVTYDPSLAP